MGNASTPELRQFWRQKGIQLGTTSNQGVPSKVTSECVTYNESTTKMKFSEQLRLCLLQINEEDKKSYLNTRKIYHLEKKSVKHDKVKPCSLYFLLLKQCFDSCLLAIKIHASYRHITAETSCAQTERLHHESERHRSMRTIGWIPEYVSWSFTLLFFLLHACHEKWIKKIVQTRQHFRLICHEPVSQHASQRCCVPL